MVLSLNGGVSVLDTFSLINSKSKVDLSDDLVIGNFDSMTDIFYQSCFSLDNRKIERLYVGSIL